MVSLMTCRSKKNCGFFFFFFLILTSNFHLNVHKSVIVADAYSKYNIYIIDFKLSVKIGKKKKKKTFNHFVIYIWK